jgi:carbamate kinase
LTSLSIYFSFDIFFNTRDNGVYMEKLAVVAIGGNSLIKDNRHQSAQDQKRAVEETCVHLVDLVAQGYKLVITHGNGPQVGFLLLRSEIAKKHLPQDPLDSCVADTQGSLGYYIQQGLYNEFSRREITRTAITVITQVEVSLNDPAFSEPTKPIGPFYTKKEAAELRCQGWNMIEDAGRGWRRVVPSPIPKKIIELDAISSLIDQGFVVIGAGGGGIPVIRNENGTLEGVAAVIDKDLASSLLAQNLNADLLIISTAVEKVSLHFGKPEQRDIDRMTAWEAQRYLEEGHFAEGSMAPKIRASISFLKHGGKEAVITTPFKLKEALKGRTGTHIVA